MLFLTDRVAYRVCLWACALLLYSHLSAKKAEKATLMSLRGAYYTSDDYTYMPLENGDKLCMGRLEFTSMQYQQLDLPSADTLGFPYQNYISLFGHNVMKSTWLFFLLSFILSRPFSTSVKKSPDTGPQTLLLWVEI